MYKTRVLDLYDIFRLKKDLLWGKYYYGSFENGKLTNSILFSQYFESKYLIELHNIEQHSQELVRDFVSEFSLNKQIHYFLREIDESTGALEIEFMQSCGFHRFNRNYCFEYNSSKHSPKDHINLNVFCRSAEKHDINKLIELDVESQILEYRELLHKNKKFVKGNLENTFVFSDSNNLDRIYGFAYKRDGEHHSSFELVLAAKQEINIDQLMQAFSETYVHFEKNSPDFRFIIKEDQINDLDNLCKNYDLIWSSQLLILEGNPRNKSKLLQSSLQFKNKLNTSPALKVP